MFTIHNPFYSRCLHGGDARFVNILDSLLFKRRFRELHRLVTRDTRHRDFPRRCACHQRSYVDDGAGHNNGWRNPRNQRRAAIVHAHALYHNPCPLWSNTHCINLSGFTVRDTWDGRGPPKCVIPVFRGPPSVNRSALIEPADVFTGSCPLNGWCLIYTLINPDLIQLSLHFSACLLLTFLIFLQLKFLLFFPDSGTLATNLPSRQKVLLCLLLTYL